MGGAMENWGLIIYRESTLLYEEGVSSIFNEDVITGVVAHELVHQWFGNLVTMKWWNNLWLNEGFATYLAYLGVNHVHPEWNITDFMVLNEFQFVFGVDALTSSRPLIREERDIQGPHAIGEMFSAITYSKGAAVLRMLSDYISERVFKIGLRKYLKALQYSNADEQDLWKYLQEAVDEVTPYIKVSEVMYTWTRQTGYPLITINTTTGELYQQRFLLNDSAPSYDLAWSVPIKVMKQNAAPIMELFSGIDPETRPAFRAEKDQWVLANVGCTGYYRVNYNQENWERLLHQLETNHHAIPRLNRAQIIDDAFNLARAHHVDVTLALRSTRYLRNERDFIPWEAAIRNLDYFILMFDRSEVYGPMQAYLRKQVSDLYEHFENLTLTSSVPATYSEQNNHLNAIEVACNNRLPACQSMVQTLFKEWMANVSNNPIHVNLRFSVYCLALAHGGEEEWEFAWSMYQNATSVSEKNNLHYALSCTSHIWLLNRYLQHTLDPSKIRKMDAVSTINDVAKNVAGQALAWDFVRAHWTYLMEEYGVGIMSFDNLIDGVTERFSTSFELQQLRLFQSAHGEKGLGPASRAVEQAIERTQANMQWVRENKRTVLEWLRAELKNP